MKIKIVISLMFACLIALFTSIAHAEGAKVHQRAKAKRASTAVVPYSRCAWGPAMGAAPQGWAVLICGSGKQAEKPYAIAPEKSASWDDTEVLRPVLRIVSVSSDRIVVGVNVKGGKEYVYDIPRAKLPKASKGEWYTPDPAVVATFRAMDKAGQLPAIAGE